MIKRLDWDSDLFGYEVGKIKVEKSFNIAQFEREAQNFQLIYLFSQSIIPNLSDNIRPMGTHINLMLNVNRTLKKNQPPYYINEKTGKIKGVVENYRIGLNHNGSHEGNVSNPIISEDLVKLALISGEFSRFNLDKRLSKYEYERLYTSWILNAAKGREKVLVYNNDQKIKGFVTLFSGNKIGRIGLIAVAEEFRGKGIGTELLDAVLTICVQEGLLGVEIGTQKANSPAMGLYQKVGFQVAEEKEIYHWWKD